MADSQSTAGPYAGTRRHRDLNRTYRVGITYSQAAVGPEKTAWAGIAAAHAEITAHGSRDRLAAQ